MRMGDYGGIQHFPRETAGQQELVSWVPLPYCGPVTLLMRIMSFSYFWNMSCCSTTPSSSKSVEGPPNQPTTRTYLTRPNHHNQLLQVGRIPGNHTYTWPREDGRQLHTSSVGHYNLACGSKPYLSSSSHNPLQLLHSNAILYRQTQRTPATLCCCNTVDTKVLVC